MNMNINFDEQIILQLLMSLIVGAIIGIEREYWTKSAGFRTIIMICLGSTLFTMVSIRMGASVSPDRIASNIVTGIGFLGAGVIFKDGLTVTGITTATTIWIAAALGMTIGAGEYFIAMAGTGIVLIVLSVFEKVTIFIDKIHQTRTYRINFSSYIDESKTIEEELNKNQLRFKHKKEIKHNDYYVYVYEIHGKEKNLDHFNLYLKLNENVKGFEY